MSTITLPAEALRPPVLRIDSGAVARHWGLAFLAFVAISWLASLAIGFQAALTVLTAFSFLAAIIGLAWPLVGVFGIGIVCTVDPLTRTFLMSGGVLRWNTLNYLLVGVALMSTPLLLRQKSVHFRLLLALLLLLLVEIAGSPSIAPGALHVLNAASAFGLLVYFVRASRFPDMMYWFGLINGLVGAAGGLAYYRQMKDLPAIDANAFSQFPLTAILSICLAISCAQGRQKRQLLLGLLAAVNFCWVFLTGSRGGILVGVFAVVVLLWQVRGASMKLPLIGLAAVIVLGAFALFGDLQARTLHRITKMLDSNYSAAGRTSGRSDLALGAWYLFLDHPFGVGTGGYAENWAKLGYREGLSGFGAGEEKNCHSGWLKVLSENGVPGILIFFAYVTSFAVVGWRRRRQGLLALGLLTTASLSVAFLSVEFQSKGQWMLAAATTVVFSRRVAARSQPYAGLGGPRPALILDIAPLRRPGGPGGADA